MAKSYEYLHEFFEDVCNIEDRDKRIVFVKENAFKQAKTILLLCYNDKFKLDLVSLVTQPVVLAQVSLRSIASQSLAVSKESNKNKYILTCSPSEKGNSLRAKGSLRFRIAPFQLSLVLKTCSD